MGARPLWPLAAAIDPKEATSACFVKARITCVTASPQTFHAVTACAATIYSSGASTTMRDCRLDNDIHYSTHFGLACERQLPYYYVCARCLGSNGIL